MQLSVSRNPAWDLIEIPIDDHGRFDLDNLPQEAYTLGFRSKKLVIDETKENYHLTEEQRFAWGLTRDTSSLEIRLRRLRDDELPLGRVLKALKSTTWGRARTSLNQKDVRIVYDRDLFMELPEIK